MEQSPPSEPPEKADPLADARALLAADEQTRMQACAAEIEQVLVKYGMRIDVTPAQISIVAVQGGQ